MIDHRTENLIPIRQAPGHIPGRPHISAVYRWLNRPMRPLESLMIGGRRFTSQEAIDRFIANGHDHDHDHDQAATSISTRRSREIEAAEKRLDAAGVR